MRNRSVLSRSVPFWALLCVGCAAETFSPSTTFTIDVVSGAIAAYTAPGEPIAPLLLRVLDDRGVPVVGHPVSVIVNAGGGIATLGANVSGPEGLITLSWTVGPMPGVQRATVTPLGGEARVFTTEATGFNAAQLSVGLGMACAIDFDARAWCWGDGWRDGIARGDSGIDVKPDWRPIPVTGGHHFKAIAAGGDATCAIDLDGAAWCWGADDNGQLGQGAPTAGRCFTTLPCSRYPLPVSGGHTFEMIVAAGPTMCAVDGSGAVWCWGENETGEAGIGGGSPLTVYTPTAALTSDSAAQLEAGDNTFCARYATGAVECWGGNSQGEVGNPVGSRVPSPIPPQTAELFVKLFAAPDGFCGRRADGATWCWGEIYGSGAVPMRQAALDPFTVIGGDWLGSGWALDQQGRLHRFYRTTFTDVSGGVRLTTIGSGAESGCGLGAGGQVWCWGSNSEGELGNGSVSAAYDYWHFPPVPVGGWYPLP